MNQEMLEMLLGKFLDSEITPSEQQMLEKELECNPSARAMLRQWQRLRDQSRAALSAELIEQGRSGADIFARAWSQPGTGRRRRPLKLGAWSRFAAGLAAGFLISLGVFWERSPFFTGGGPASSPPVKIARHVDERPTGQGRVYNVLRSGSVPRVMRNIDWYNLTGDSGEQWLFEVYRENNITPAVYHGDL